MQAQTNKQRKINQKIRTENIKIEYAEFKLNLLNETSCHMKHALQSGVCCDGPCDTIYNKIS